MRKTRCIILFISLLLPMGGYACWWDDDDDYDIDGGNYLDEDVIITPDDDYDYDYDWNDDDNSDSDFWEDDYSTEYDEEEDNDYISNDGGSSSIGKQYYHDFKAYAIKDGDKTIIENTKCPHWAKQDKGSQTCVLVAMEYASNILLNPDTYIPTRETFANYYSEMRSGWDVYKLGVLPEDLNTLITSVFDATKISLQSSMMSAICNGYPLLATIESNIEGIRTAAGHEITIIGYTQDKTLYICIDPADGQYKTISYWSLDRPIYEIKKRRK